MKYSDAARSCQPRCGNWVDRTRHRLQRLLWPATCLLCGGRAGADELDLCAGCEGDLPTNHPACSVCAEHLPGCDEHRPVCGACLRHRPPFHKSVVPFRYAYPLDHLVRGLKFRNELPCGRVLGELFARRLLAREEVLPDAIVPVPLATRRYRERGYNQASELAVSIQRVARVTVRSDLVVRQRETAEQADLNRKQRRKNVRGAFAVTATSQLPPHIAILDDVVTTGSTVTELAKVLRRAGAQRVEVWAIARAGRES